MKLSEYTVEVLKNFASINPNLLIKPGQVQRTCSTSKMLYAETTLFESFDKEIGIYDLNKFLALMSMKQGSPDVEIEDASFAFKALNRGKIRMRFTEPKILIAPERAIGETKYEVEFKISQEILNWINSAAAILKAPNIIFESDEGEITISAADANGAMTDDASIPVEGNSKHKFVAILNLDNINFIPGDYQVSLSSGGHIKWANMTKGKDMTYWTALAAEDAKKIRKSEFDGKPMGRKKK